MDWLANLINWIFKTFIMGIWKIILWIIEILSKLFS